MLALNLTEHLDKFLPNQPYRRFSWRSLPPNKGSAHLASQANLPPPPLPSGDNPMSLEVINVQYLGQQVGAASFDTTTGIGALNTAPAFIDTGIELSPKMPLAKRIYLFPELDPASFKGLPGLLCRLSAR